MAKKANTAKVETVETVKVKKARGKAAEQVAAPVEGRKVKAAKKTAETVAPLAATMVEKKARGRKAGAVVEAPEVEAKPESCLAFITRLLIENKAAKKPDAELLDAWKAAFPEKAIGTSWMRISVVRAWLNKDAAKGLRKIPKGFTSKSYAAKKGGAK